MRKRHKKNRYRPYIRKFRKDDTAEDFRTALKLAAFEGRDKAYVLKQHGFKRFTMNVGASRKAIKESILAVACDKKSLSKAFEAWTKRVRDRAKGVK